MPKINIDSESTIVKPEIYKKSGKNIVVEFDKCFNTNKTNLNLFLITKSSYAKQLDVICRYSNTFFKCYDKDNEFLTGLLVIKYNIDNVNIHYSMKQFISDISEFLLTDSIINKIFKMVDDYYEIDLSPTDDVKDIDLHALQFMNEHGKALMALAVAYKLTIPVVCHYYAVNSDKINELCKIRGQRPMPVKEFIYQVFLSYFPLFQGDSEMFNKLVITANCHLQQTKTSDKVLWTRAKNKKITPTIYTDKLVCSIIADLLPKSIFKKNFVFLIQSSLPLQIKNQLLQKDKFEFCDISMSAKTDELSGLEKMEANNARISDLDVVISSLNIDNTIKKIEKKYNIKIADDELDYYKEHLRSYSFNEIILQFFASYFGGFYDLKSISKKNYIRILIIFKKIMTDMGFVYIQQIMTGNISKNIKRRKVSTKQLTKIENSRRFKKIMKNYSMGMDELKNSIIYNIADLINTPVEYVDYDHPEWLGKDIKSDFDIITDEYLRFVNML